MRKQTILDIAEDRMITNKFNWKEQLKKEIIGTTVLTEYTNKTYQIDDIVFNMNPKSTFTEAYKENSTSYLEYYKTRYNIIIKDENQFMLVSNAKARDLRAGRADHIYLIPELCRATGMTDEMRANFKLMQELATYTRLNPDKRVKALKKFNNRVQTTPESVNVLREWNMELEQELMTVDARELPPEPIIFGDGVETTTNAKGEWILSNSMYKSVPINRWMCIFPAKLADETKSFISALNGACAQMNSEITEPIM